MRLIIYLSVYIVITYNLCGCDRKSNHKAPEEQKHLSAPNDAKDNRQANRDRYKFGGQVTLRVKHVDLESIRETFLLLFIQKIRKLIPKYTELEGFPKEERSGVLILSDTILVAANKSGTKWRKEAGYIYICIRKAGDLDQVKWPLRLNVVTTDWQPSTRMPLSSFDKDRIVFDCRTKNIELQKKLFEIAKECFKQLEEP